MKSVSTQKKPPATPAEWEEMIAAAPGTDRAATVTEKQKLAHAVVVDGGGFAAVRAAMVGQRKRGERGAQVAPIKQLVSVRYSLEVLQYFKASGKGWQTRMNEALLDWVNQRSQRGRSRV